MRHRGRRRGNPRAGGRARAEAATTWRERGRAGARGRGRPAPDRAQQRRRPRRHLLRARVAQGAALRGGRARAVRVLRGARHPVRAPRQADRGARRGRAGAGSTSSSAAAARTACPGCAGSTPTACARSSRTPAGSRRCTRRRPAWWTSRPWRARWPPISSADGGRVQPGCEVTAIERRDGRVAAGRTRAARPALASRSSARACGPTSSP